MSQPDPAVVARIVGELRRARRLLFITGAGISADSGLPTYRWIDYDDVGAGKIYTWGLITFEIQCK